MNRVLPMTVPTCLCCDEPRALLARHDLPGGLLACTATGQLYRPEGDTLMPTEMPELPRARREVTGVQIDLSRSGYA